MADITTTAVSALFYLVFACQIVLISLFYPRKLMARMTYVLEHFPPAEYPKLYPDAGPGFEASMKGKARLYLAVNMIIAALGVVAMGLMLTWGLSRGACAGYFILQAMPYLYLSIKEMAQFKAMRAAYRPRLRVADLTPRRLSDFVALPYVAVAAVLYVAWLAFFLSGKGAPESWGTSVVATLLLISGMNLAYVFIIRRFISGKKLNPIAGHADQMLQTKTTVKGLVYSSIGVSLFLIVIDAMRRYGLHDVGPVVTSFYMQACVVFAIGMTLDKIRPETMDFDVYKPDDTLPAG
ncbi:hypothetical protein [Kordiimonas marina]|uniref:hypothetical protein n=1 Tax=Kordiimonas marina TaxID=2872312 RepID=UPI001FF178F2|nr:hypothetical protein [Kordiimonas marina]MCJ9429466.1 hypothetical protein [Kordiimonas marina]